MALDNPNVKTVLIAPAYKKYNVSPTHVTRRGETVVLHSICDEVISVKDSADLVTEHGYRLHVCGANHRMSDKDALTMLAKVLYD